MVGHFHTSGNQTTGKYHRRHDNVHLNAAALSNRPGQAFCVSVKATETGSL